MQPLSSGHFAGPVRSRESRIETEKKRWSRNLGEFHGARTSSRGGVPGTRMKIHERLKSKAVDIHILKMASLTLNGQHYALATNTAVCFARAYMYIPCSRTRIRENSRENSRAKATYAASRCACRFPTTMTTATLLLGMRR